MIQQILLVFYKFYQLFILHLDSALKILTTYVNFVARYCNFILLLNKKFIYTAVDYLENYDKAESTTREIKKS